MDTKWKSIRKVVSFIVFFLGVTLTLWNLPGMFQRMPYLFIHTIEQPAVSDFTDPTAGMDVSQTGVPAKPGMFQRMPGKLFSGTGAAAFEEDYQQGRSFRQYISNCLENFLSIAINGCPTYWSDQVRVGIQQLTVIGNAVKQVFIFFHAGKIVPDQLFLSPLQARFLFLRQSLLLFLFPFVPVIPSILAISR